MMVSESQMLEWHSKQCKESHLGIQLSQIVISKIWLGLQVHHIKFVLAHVEILLDPALEAGGIKNVTTKGQANVMSCKNPPT